MPCLSLLLPNTALNARYSRRKFTQSRSFWTVLLSPFRYSTRSAEETALCPCWMRSEKFPPCPLLLLNEVREIPILPLSDTVLNAFVFQAGTPLTSLMLYQNSANIQWCLHPRGIGDLSLSLRDCPCPCWTGAIYRCIYAIVFPCRTAFH